MYYYVYVDTQRQYRWTLFAANGRKIADSAEGYHNKADCIHGINLTAGSNGAPIKHAA